MTLHTRIPKEGEIVDVRAGEGWQDAEVYMCLSSQFTAYEGDHLNWYFYSDHGTTWRKKGTEDKYRFGRSGKC